MTDRLLLAYGLIGFMLLMGACLLLLVAMRRRKKRQASGQIRLRFEK